MEDIIRQFNLDPHPEGGFFREIYRSRQQVWSDAASADRAASTHIYFLLPKGQVSRFHRVIHDEIWHIYQGDPLRLIQFDGTCVMETSIGRGCSDYTAVVPAGVWQAAATTGTHTLTGCTVAPGFDFTDFSFLADHPADLERFNFLGTGLHAFI
ncbi:MAG: cupin domain-containing protein [Desulfotignum sp.]|nr:cupin domain-containing protein [Desulfotignum sp.]